jgi:predicted AAA+ superfamily ATPase
MNFTRYLASFISDDLKDKMVFIGGPRQVGKTTLSKTFIKDKRQYLSWDDLADREVLKHHQVNPELKCVVLDEIHKYVRWRTLVKGLFDKYRETLSILVTGSARLDHFRKGGDSLVGRYHYYRLHPLTLPELREQGDVHTLQSLLKFGGFPEPLKKANATFYRRWRRERVSRLVYQDLRDLNTIGDLSKLELLVDALPGRVGSVLSIKSLQVDLEVSPNTVSRWIEVLEGVYYCYRVLPYGSPKIRAVKKSAKLYLWDWAEVESPGSRFENLVASHLLKLCHFLEDTEGHRMELRFIRDTDLREVDFVVIKDRKPLFAVECKTGESHVSPHLKYFRDRTPIPLFFQVHLGTKHIKDGNIELMPFSKFCERCKLV